MDKLPPLEEYDHLNTSVPINVRFDGLSVEINVDVLASAILSSNRGGRRILSAMVKQNAKRKLIRKEEWLERLQEMDQGA